MTGNNGRIDLLGKPRAEAAYTRVAFERETGPFIAIKPVYQKENLQSDRMGTVQRLWRAGHGGVCRRKSGG